MIHTPSDKGEMALQELQQLRAQQGNANTGQPANAKQQQADVSFGDVLDIVNPLQHIPGVSNVYREITGDEISGHARVMGGALYGGPIGMLGGALGAAMTEESGQSMPHTLASAFTGDDSGAGTKNATKTAAASNATGAAVDETTRDAPESGDAARAATAALPSGIESVLPAAPANTAAANGGGQTAANPRGAQPANDGEVLQGKDALAAFARDKAAQANGEATASGRSRTDSSAQQASRTQDASQRRASAGERAASLNQQQQFMKLRDSDYATSAEMRARMDHLKDYQAQAANDVSSRTDHNASVTEGSNHAGNQGVQPAGAPDDFASRMKEALSKYRSMHNNE